MKIHIHCPGSMQDGLHSPSRGESRWTQNLALMLAKAGHNIVVTAGGRPSWGSTQPIDNVLLVPEGISKNVLNSYGPFHISMDSARWKDKEHALKAERYLNLKWSIEDYTRSERLPENEFLCYPLNIGSEGFFKEDCVNRDKTFFLPLPFGEEMCGPNFHKDGLLWTCKDIDREKVFRDNAFMVAEKVLYPLLEEDGNLFVVWLMRNLLKRQGFNAVVRDKKDISVPDLLTYDKLREVLKDCRLVVSINIPGSVFDAAFMGVPTLEWERGGFFNSIGKKHGVLIEDGATPERVLEVIKSLLENETLYSSYVADIQKEIMCNTNTSSLGYFNRMIKEIF